MGFAGHVAPRIGTFRRFEALFRRTLCRALGLAAAFLPAVAAVAQHRAPGKPEEPIVQPDDGTAERAMQAMKIPRTWTRALFAAEPLLANPVAIEIDRQGRIYVCETFRANRGVEDNRRHMDWLDDDLAAQRVADRLAYLKKRLGDRLEEHTRYDDRLRLIVDRDGDGRADRSTVFADHFNTPVSGIGSSALALPDGGVLYACIPDLWRLEDRDGDGKADVRTSWFYGFGVRFAFFGHDLHGLCIGPDGRVYFSIGDRGFNVRTDRARIDRADGSFTLTGTSQLKNTESGSVLRCELDGTGLEIVATGLRNPQELAFDELGDLFTGDNNSDSGDRARWVYVVPHGDSGWRMAYQYLPDRGPFNREKIWHPYHAQQPAYIVPPIANVGDGPSGLVYYPGTGFGKELERTFLLADFRGAAGQSGIRAIRVERQGAFFKLTQNKKLVWNVLATDLDFGPDSSLYVADWVNGWEGLGRGRIYRLSHKQHGELEQVKEVHTLLTGGFAGLATARLIDLLGHADQRVRIGASIELASRSSADAKDGDEPGIARRLLDCAGDSNRPRTQRLHAMWAYRMVARRRGVRAPKALFLQLIRDADDEIRRAALHWAGDLRRFDIDPAVFGRGLADRSPRVKAAAALALYRVGRKFDDESRHLFAMSVRDLLAENADRDPVLRHACVMAWTGLASPQQIEQFGFEGSVPVRRAAIVALRRLKSPRVANLLMHSSRFVREEAARAIYDEPIPEAMEQLAAAVWRGVGSDAFTRRALAANYRLGDEASAERIATFLSRADCPASMREEAWSMLEHWARPPGRDRVLGMWRPITTRTSRPAANAVQAHWDQWKSDTKMAPRAALAAVRVGLVVSLPYLVHAVVDASRPASYRAEAIQAIDAHDARQGLNWARRLVDDSHAELRGVARRIMVDRAPIEALPLVIESVRSGTRRERQDALRLLGTLKHPSAEKELLRLFALWTDGRLAPAIGLELLEAVRQYTKRFGSAELKRKLEAYEASRAALPLADRYRELQAGGDASRGRDVFFGDVRASCSRCHTIDGRGGLVGPDLTHVAKDKDRKQLLESIIDPNRTIAKGFETIALFIDDGRVITGIVRSEDQRQLVLIDADGRQMVISKESIEERHTTTSAMPRDMLKQLPPGVIRDLVEFLSARK